MPSGDSDFDADVSSLAALGDPIRRELYRFVIAQSAPVSREQAALGIDVPQHVAKFHLDKLERDGLLETEYSRPPGRSGPGAGRPSKRYRRARREISVTLPERHYDLAGRVLAEAVTAAARSTTPLDEALHIAAADTGRALAGTPRHDATPDAAHAVCRILAEHGYEPRDSPAGITLANCPFHSLAQDYTELVCGLNLDLIRGLLDGLDAHGLQALLDPAPNRCCVVLARAEG